MWWFNVEDISLEKYTNIAKKIVNKYLAGFNKSARIDRNLLIGETVNTLYDSDQKYNPEYGISLYQFRVKNCYRRLNKLQKMEGKIYKKDQNITMHLYKHRKETSKQNATSEYLDYFINNSSLTESQVKHINLLRQGYNYNEISNITGKNYKNVHAIIKSAVDKMRRLVK